MHKVTTKFCNNLCNVQNNIPGCGDEEEYRRKRDAGVDEKDL